MKPAAPTALIAEDEPLLALALQAELATVWPALQICATVGDGASAVTQALTLQPDVLFFDIRMPGQSGLEAAAELAEAWPTTGRPFPALVFVTAYDQHALEAFDAQAVDYVLKPVQTARLARTVEKIQRTLPAPHTAAPASQGMDHTLEQLRQLLLPAAPALAHLRHIQASVGNQIHLVPVQDVLYFEAADKYVRVLTASHEYLIRTPLKDLLPQLDPSQFWQVHRGTVVRADAIERVLRDEAGKLSLALRGRAEVLGVGRVYGGLFRGM